MRIDLIYTESERTVRELLERKWRQHIEQGEIMAKIMREFGLGQVSAAQELTRALGVQRVEVTGENYKLVNNDCVLEARNQESNSVGLVLTSIPFSTQYEYSPNYADFGHSDDNEHFFEQMDYLTPELLRVLQPGRLAAVHVKDRVVPKGVGDQAFQTVYPFHVDTITHFKKHGFAYMGMKTIVTDVVRENAQTYRLGWSEQCKDGTKMGVGSPEYVVLLHKPQTDRSRGYADIPVSKEKADYTRARWQVDAHAFWRSSGNRLLLPDELALLGHDKLAKAFTAFTLTKPYDYEEHVSIGEALDRLGALPSTFMSLAPGSHHDEVWHDVNRMRTLNGEQTQRGLQNHVCPLQFDIVDRLIGRYSNPGDEVFDPFGGLFTVPLRAIKKGRRGRAAELNPEYFRDGLRYLQTEEKQQAMPDLFGAIEDAA